MKISLKSKTLWAGVAGVISAIGGYFTGTLELNGSMAIGLTSLVGIFLRDSNAKIESTVKDALDIVDEIRKQQVK